jgi:hypothetical protein
MYKQNTGIPGIKKFVAAVLRMPGSILQEKNFYAPAFG